MIPASYARNGEIQSLNFTDARQFLQQNDRGVYTTAFVKEVYSVVDWGHHITRLCKSLKALHTTLGGGLFDTYYTHLEQQHQNTTEEEEEHLLTQLLLPTVLTALNTATTSTDPVILNILLCPSTTTNTPLDIHAVVAHQTTTPINQPQQPTHAVILGHPRQIPIGKDSGWITDRKQWEAMKPAHAGEVLLCNQDGKLLEGLITNLYVVVQEDDGGGSGRGSSGRYIVQTAGMEDSVVWGTIRQHVERVCGQLDIGFVEQAPDMKDRHTWKEAFLSNSLRVIQPLKSIACDERNFYGHEAWELSFKCVPGEVTTKVLEGILQEMPAVDVRAL